VLSPNAQKLNGDKLHIGKHTGDKGESGMVMLSDRDAKVKEEAKK
jgi:hypothetical protein